MNNTKTKSYHLLLKNGDVVLPSGVVRNINIAINYDKIVAIGNCEAKNANKVIDIKGLTVLPGIIDTHVHFREPGFTHLETIKTGSLAALKGGVSAFCEMPNTDPPTITHSALLAKLNIANKNSYVDYAFYMGAAKNNINEIKLAQKLKSGVAGIKIFMGSSTGSLLIDDVKLLEKIIKASKKIIAVHAEDEQRLNMRKKYRKENDPSSHSLWRDSKCAVIAIRKFCKLINLHNKKGHILHISSKAELEELEKVKNKNPNSITFEATPHHLLLSSINAYKKFANNALVNPPIRSKEDLECLWQNIKNGQVDTIGSDHAPHSLKSRAKKYPFTPSGISAVQYTTPLLLSEFKKRNIPLLRFAQLFSENPARIYKMKNRGKIKIGYLANLTIVDLKKRAKANINEQASKSEINIYKDYNLTGWPRIVILNGKIALFENEVIKKPCSKAIDFI